MTADEHDFACRLPEEQQEAARRDAWQFLEETVEETRELENGYAFRFPGGEEVTRTVLEAVERERDCCPFFRFELEMAPDQGPIWWKFLGPDGVKRFLEEELGKIAEAGER